MRNTGGVCTHQPGPSGGALVCPPSVSAAPEGGLVNQVSPRQSPAAPNWINEAARAPASVGHAPRSRPRGRRALYFLRRKWRGAPKERPGSSEGLCPRRSSVRRGLGAPPAAHHLAAPTRFPTLLVALTPSHAECEGACPCGGRKRGQLANGRWRIHCFRISTFPRCNQPASRSPRTPTDGFVV